VLKLFDPFGCYVHGRRGFFFLINYRTVQRSFLSVVLIGTFDFVQEIKAEMIPSITIDTPEGQVSLHEWDSNVLQNAESNVAVKITVDIEEGCNIHSNTCDIYRLRLQNCPGQEEGTPPSPFFS